MKKFLILILTLSLSAGSVLPVCAAGEPADAAKAAIVYQPASNTVLYEKNADERLLVASTTKIMTALVVLNNCRLDESVEVKPEHCAVEGSSMYLRPGREYSVRDLLYGMMLASGNDAAAALAEHTAGSMEKFAGLMNEECRSLGLENTHFENAHGLDSENHYSSARDMALITAQALKNSTFREIFSARTYTVDGQCYTNHNKLLKICPGCTGGKTGYTRAAGRVLVSCVQRESMELICVTISDPDDWNDHIALYSWAYDSYSYVPALDGVRRISVISGVEERVDIEPAVEGMVLAKGCEYSASIYIPRFVFAPVLEGKRAGEVRVDADGQEYIIPVYYGQTVLMDGAIPLTPWERFKRAWYLSNKYGIYYPGG